MDDERPWTWSVDDPRLHFGQPDTPAPMVTKEQIEAELLLLIATTQPR